MAILKPFRAWRPKAEVAEKVASVPYDVIDTDEARNLAEGNPHSFLHVIRPEIDLPADTGIYDTRVYEQGRDNLSALLGSEFYTQEEEEALYIYQLKWQGRTQTGIFGCVSVRDYDHEVILKHELTRPDKEDDRTKHILTMRAHPEPVMMTFRDNDEIIRMMNEATRGDFLYQFTDENEVQHTLWKVESPESLVLSFADIPKIFIADGHHRCASASRAAHEIASQSPEHSGKEEYNFFPAVIFPESEMSILSYNRIIFDVPDNFMDVLSSEFELTEDANPAPSEKGTIAIYTSGKWTSLTLPESSKKDVASQLDVARLQEYILDPVLGIKDQRRDNNISFVGGVKGSAELERLVDTGKAAAAISLFPTSIEELITVSEAGLLMPPKSTWFEPKLRSGLLIHTFNSPLT